MLDESVGFRQLQATSNSSICSGIGIPVATASNVTVYTCSGVPVSLALYTSITSVQNDGGSVASVAALTTALLAGNTSFSALLSPSARSQTVNLTSLTAAQRLGLTTLLGLPANATVVPTSTLFPASQPVAVTAAVIGILGGPATASFLNGTSCTVGTSATGSATRCVCPLDFTGAACDIPRHYQCTVMLADPLYHACVASNSRGFLPPSLGASSCSTSTAAQARGEDVFESSARVGVASTDTTAQSYHIPRPAGSSGFRGYETLTSGDPPCLYFNRACGDAVPLPLTLRVACAFLDINVTSVTAPGQVFVDGAGLPYLNRARAARNSTAGLAVAYLPPYLPASAAALPTGVACNGTALTQAALAAFGVNLTTTTAPPPWYGLACVEQGFKYVLGSPTSPWFALSSPPAIPLAVAARALPSVYISDRSGTAIVPLPVAAMNGSVDVTVALPAAAALAGDAGYWVGGRLYSELRVVQVPEPAFPGFTSASAAALLQLDTVARGVTDAARMRTVTAPLLLLTNVYRVVVDDTAYVEPTGKDLRPVILGVVLGLGLPIVMTAAGAIWWRARARRRKEEAELQQAIARQAATELSQRDGRAERELLQALTTHDVLRPTPVVDADALHRAAFAPVPAASPVNGLRQRGGDR